MRVRYRLSYPYLYHGDKYNRLNPKPIIIHYITLHYITLHYVAPEMSLTVKITVIKSQSQKPPKKIVSIPVKQNYCFFFVLIPVSKIGQEI